MAPPVTPTLLRFRGLTVRDAAGCLLWCGSCNSRGVPVFHDQGRTVSVRRYAYTLTGKPLPEGKLTTTCGNRLCVEPTHLIEVK